MSDSSWMTWGEGGLIGAVAGWFANLLYMREKFVSSEECKNCKAGLCNSESLSLNSFEGRIKKVEENVNELYGMAKENYGMIKEMHGMLKAEERGKK